MRKTALLCFSAVVLSVMFTPAFAQETYPSAPIRLVLGFPPGATTDVVARLLAQKLGSQMNVSIVVDNKPGANGNVGTEFVAKARPDGYTLLVNTSGVSLSPALGEKLGYDILKDLVPIALVAATPSSLVVHPSLPANTPAEFITYARANPNKLAYGSTGIGNITHLGVVVFLQANGLTALHVPYKGAAPANIDLVAGRVQFRFSEMASVLPLVREKRIRLLALTGLKRSPLLPDVPTLSESVMPGFEAGGWFGLMAPAQTSPAIIRRLNAEVMRALQDPESQARLTGENAEPRGSTPEEYTAYIKSELERWTRIVKSADVKPE